jgi:tripartite-type tricarboxylate transporter receptor subunit TctC
VAHAAKKKPMEDAMNHTRRKFLRLTTGLAFLPALPQIARAETYPARQARIIVGFAAGGGTDITARLIGQRLNEKLNQPFIVENRPGAGANIGMDAVAKAAPDGYTLLLVSPGSAINASLYEKLNYNFIRDIAPIAGIHRTPNVLAVHPSFPAKTLAEFVAYAKANPGKVNVGTSGIGASDHMSGELFRMMVGVDIVQVHYRGAAPAITDLLAGQVPASFAPMAPALEHLKAGKLRPLAVTTLTRSEALPDIPTINESVPGFESSTWYGLATPMGTPAAIIDTLNKEVNAALADPSMSKRFADLGGVPIPGSPADFGKLIADETEKWAKVVKFANVKLD